MGRKKSAYAKITNCPEMTQLPKHKSNLAKKAQMSWQSGPKRMSRPYKCKNDILQSIKTNGSKQTSEIPKESQQGNLKSKGKKLKRNEAKNPKEIE